MEASRKENLPIGRDTENIMKEWIRIADNIPKSFRYTIYPIILKTLAEMISDVYFANADKEYRRQYLMNYIARLQSIKALTRVLHEGKAFNHKKADYLFILYENVSQQAVKWKNYSKI